MREVRASVGLVGPAYGAINMVFEGLKQKKSMVIVAATAVESVRLGVLTALGQP